MTSIDELRLVLAFTLAIATAGFVMSYLHVLYVFRDKIFKRVRK